MHHSHSQNRSTRQLRIGRDASTNRRLAANSNLKYNGLEPRLALAVSIDFDPSVGIVSITSDASSDSALVTAIGTDQIEVSGTGASNQTFLLNFLYRIDFFGGGGDDTFENQTGVETRAWGHTGADELIGGSGIDLLNGGPGDDQLYGNGGTDTLLGGEDDDWLYGGDGYDQLLAFTGNDYLNGGAGDDYLYGQAGNDQVYGFAGNDGVRGNLGIDSLYGGDGNDYLMGDTENDTLYGEAGNDQLFAWTGDDTLDGGSGDDNLYAHDGTDLLVGGVGADLLRGGSGDDTLQGDDGDDRLYGEAGDDLLRGNVGVDLLRGGDGMDSIFGGGLAALDSMYGDAGADRFLKQGNDFVGDATAIDSVVRFIDETSSWTDREIEVLDVAFDRLCDRTGNTRLLRDSLDTNDLGFFKYSDLGGAAGVNQLSTSGHQEWNPTTGQWEWVYIYEREIKILDWNENSNWYNEQFQLVAIHEIGHSWDSQLEMSMISAQTGGLWTSFLSQSGWVNSNPNDPGNYTQSLDGDWWYLSNSAFAENYGRTNPNEDMATIWEYYFNPDRDESLAPSLQGKLGVLDIFLDAVSA